MSKEEKKAIEIYEEDIRIAREYYENEEDFKADGEYNKVILLNLIDKLKKENEELKIKNSNYEEGKILSKKQLEMVTEGVKAGIYEQLPKEMKNFIHKDKIRKLDNECFPRYKVGFFKGQRIMGINECTYFAEKMLELLEEE